MKCPHCQSEATVKNGTAPLNDGSVALWLIEAALIASDVSSSPLRVITQTPSLFPFRLDTPVLEKHIPESRLEIARQGLDDKIVVLK